MEDSVMSSMLISVSSETRKTRTEKKTKKNKCSPSWYLFLYKKFPSFSPFLVHPFCVRGTRLLALNWCVPLYPFSQSLSWGISARGSNQVFDPRRLLDTLMKQICIHTRRESASMRYNKTDSAVHLTRDVTEPVSNLPSSHSTCLFELHLLHFDNLHNYLHFKKRFIITNYKTVCRIFSLKIYHFCIQGTLERSLFCDREIVELNK